MQDRLEIHTNENPITHYVKITKLIGPRKLDLPLEGGFYVRPASRHMVLVRPEQRPLLVLKEGMYLSPSEFREKHEFIVETRAELTPQKRKTVKIEINKPTKQKVKRKNTGVQVTISDDPFPIVTHLQALTREELPSKYLKSYLPKVWLDDDKLFSEPNHVLLEKDKEKPYSRQEITAALLHIRLAGEHLAAVNKPKARYLQYRQAATFKDGRLT